ncbi:cache domain-containing protein [bacterium]|nr:cache domain-containing protein [candidate division CSSED10-310 bacterium]
MSKRRFRFISNAFRIFSFILIILPSAGILLFVWNGAKWFVLQQTEREYTEMANCILNVVRARYDLIQNDLFLKEQHARENLDLITDTLLRTARELELESARRNLSTQRAKDIFIAITRDIAMQGLEVSVIDTDGDIVFCQQLPTGFNVSDYPWVQNLMEEDTGSFRFSWRYPGEAMESDRLLAYRLIHGWNWILYAESRVLSSETNEYADLQYQGLTDFISAYHAPAGGYAMILSVADNRIVVHPERSGGTLDDLPGVDRMIAVRKGSLSYVDAFGVNWRAGVSYFAPRQWIIAVTGREDQIINEVKGRLRIIAGAASAMIFLVLVVYFRLQRALLYSFKSKTRSSISG